MEQTVKSLHYEKTGLKLGCIKSFQSDHYVLYYIRSGLYFEENTISVS